MQVRTGFTRVAAALLIAACFAPLSAQVAFQEFPRGVLVQDMSADGSVMVGIFDTGNNVSGLYRWTAAGGYEPIGPNNYWANIHVSRDGKTIVSNMPDSNGNIHAAIWQGGKNWKLLTPFPEAVPSEQHNISGANGVSADGSVIVGYAFVSTTRKVAMRWDAGKGMVNLGTFDQGDGMDSDALAVSATGHTIVGWDFKPEFSPPGPAGIAMNQRRGAIWWDGRERLLHAFGWAGEAWATNNEGSIIVGQFHPMDQYNNLVDGGAHTYLYTAWDGHFEDLGAVSVPPGVSPKNQISTPYAVSDDGSVVVGESGLDITKNIQVAMIWTRETGMVSLGEYLTRKGVTEHQKWQLLGSAFYVSPDGRMILGRGTKDVTAGIQAFLVTLK